MIHLARVAKAVAGIHVRRQPFKTSLDRGSMSKVELEGEPDEIKQTVIILGDFAHEGLSAKIASLGFEAVKKNLRSGPKNWQRIAGLMHGLVDAGQLAAVIGYLPSPTLLHMAEPELADVRAALLAAMERARSYLFVFEDNLLGRFEPFPWELSEKPAWLDGYLESNPEIAESFTAQYTTPEQWMKENEPRILRARELLGDLASRQIEVVPFRRRHDVTLRLFEVLDSLAEGAFLRVYVPHGRYQSEQLEECLRLLGRYLREVEGRDFSVDPQRTRSGTTYIFRMRGESGSPAELHAALQRFDEFMRLVEHDEEHALAIIEAAGVSRPVAVGLLEKYRRSYRRLLTDIRQELEQKKLALAHRLELDVLEGDGPDILPGIDSGHPSSLITVAGNLGPVTLSFPGAAVAVGAPAAASIERLLLGNVQYTVEDHELLRRIEQSDDEGQRLDLRSELDRLKDKDVPAAQKQVGVQKLKSYLYKAAKYTAGKVDEVGTAVLIAYLERLVRGQP